MRSFTAPSRRTSTTLGALCIGVVLFFMTVQSPASPRKGVREEITTSREVVDRLRVQLKTGSYSERVSTDSTVTLRVKE